MFCKSFEVMDMEGSSSPTNYELSTSNASRRGGKKATRHPSYRGVRQRRNNGKWVSEVRDPNTRSRIWLGTFPEPEMAAVAHDVAVLALHGEGAARLNFPDSAHRLPRAASPSHADIQRAALQAATDFSPSSSSSFTSSSRVNEGEMIVNVGETPGGGGGEAEFVDEEAIFNMPLLLDCMAEGMLLTPPSMKRGFDWTRNDDGEEETDFTLWGSEDHYYPRT